MPAVAHNAAFTAMEIAAVAELYPGRLTIGLGHGMAGWMRQIGAYPQSPLTALAEHIRAVRAAELAGPTGSIHIEPLGIANEVKQLLAAAGSVERFAADLPDRWIDQLVIVGDLTHCADRIASLADQGIDHVILSFPAGVTPERQDTVSSQLITAAAGRLP
jgi:alkanesulfonate monooxygenase SsuD/methylene tetrahydromethanopterin reductase-like flavin-dependent oxidoreductase (luciferase family)